MDEEKAIMATQIPKTVVIKSAKSPDLRIYYEKDGNVVYGEESVFSTSVKVAVEPSEGDNDKLVHLRFYYSNKYWTGDENSAFIVATSNKKEEDASKETCTLFEPVVYKDKDYISLRHAHSGKFVLTGESKTRVALGNPESEPLLIFVNWESLVFMPNKVAFKGYNDKYLKGELIDGYPFLPFSSGDANVEEAITEVHPMPDGHHRLKSVHFDKFWAAADEADTDNKDTLFRAVRLDDKTVALRNMGNNNFCKPLSTEGKENCLNAAVSTLTKETKLVVEELVLQREIYEVRYRWEDARVFDETPFVAGTATVINRRDVEDSFAVKISYSLSSSYNFTQGYSLALGVKSTIEADLLCFTGAKIEVSATFTGTFTSGETETKTLSLEASSTVKVPPMSTATVGYVGTRGKFSIPYSYTQQEQRSYDGELVVTRDHDDGMYTGDNGYNFHFEITPFVAL